MKNDHFSHPLAREDVRRDAVEEPAVVRDDHDAAGVLEQRVLERAQRLDVEVVRRLVEEQHVAARQSVFARWSRPRSPPESVPTIFC